MPHPPQQRQKDREAGAAAVRSALRALAEAPHRLPPEHHVLRELDAGLLLMV